MKIKYFYIISFAVVFVSFLTLKADTDFKDDNYKFAFILPDNFTKTDMKETLDQDGISYSFERKDKKLAMMVLAFKLSSVKNLEDFIYTMEKDINLNIPKRNGEYTSFNNDTFDGKSAIYNDAIYTEYIYFYRTKLQDLPTNYVYMVRFISNTTNFNSESEQQIKKISDSFLPTLTY